MNNQAQNTVNSSTADPKNKSPFSFNLGNPLPALGDYDATKKFTGSITGEIDKKTVTVGQ